MQFSELALICGGKILQLPLDEPVKAIGYDTRTLPILSGAVFFAIRGSHHNGHDFIEEAYRKGIRLFVVEQDQAYRSDISVMGVPDALRAMQDMAAFHRRQFHYPVVGMTGSHGKTIVKEWLAQALDDRFHVVKSPKSFNSQLGVPLSVWGMDAHHSLGIFEAGISQVGEMERLEAMIRPTIGLFTNLGQAHQAGFAHLKQKAEEKAKLFVHAQRVIYRQEHAMVHQILSEQLKPEVLLPWRLVKSTAQQHEVRIGGATYAFHLKFSDPASIENALHVAAMLCALAVSPQEIQSRLDRLSAVKMRLEMKQAIGRSYLIDDTYHHDLYGLEVALDFLSRQNQRSKKSVILSDLYQTGLSREALYRQVHDLLAKHEVDRLVGIGKEISQARACFHLPATFYASTNEFLASDFSLNEEVALVKGARDFRFETIVNRWEQKAHGTVLEVNLDHLTHNLNFYRNQLMPHTQMMVMVKALAYGGGDFEIAQWLQFHKVDYLGVAYIDEAIALRKHGIHLPIMVMNVVASSFTRLAEYRLEPEIYSLTQLMDFIDYYKGLPASPPIHLKLETGMNRLGFAESDMESLIQLLRHHTSVRVQSLFSHLAGSDAPKHQAFTQAQAHRFLRMSKKIAQGLGHQPIRHLVNTGGITRFPEFHFDMVRLGIGLYGFDPTHRAQAHLQPVSTLKSYISQVKPVKAGETVGYDRRGVAQEDMMLAVVPIGYADGYVRRLGNGVGHMKIGGQLVPTIGNICMDMTLLDVSHVSAEPGDEVVVFGESPSVSDVAHWMGTIPYEILTLVSRRVKRVYLSE